MAHYKVKTSHGTVEFDADRADLSQQEVEDVINQNMSSGSSDGQPKQSDLELLTIGKTRPGHAFEDLAQMATMSGRGIRGITVGLENLISHPTQPYNALQRASEAVKPSYVAPKGEKLGSFIATAADPVTMGLSIAGGAPFEAGSLMAAMASGAAAGGGGTILDQLANTGKFSGKQAGFDAALGAGTAGLLHLPSTKLFSKVASAASGVGENQFNRIEQDPKLMLPESMGGAMEEGKAGEVYEEALKDAGVDPADLKFDKYNNKPADNKLFIKEVETDLDRKIAGQADVKVATKDLIKANRKVNDILGSLDPATDKTEMGAWMETKSKIKAEIAERSDKLADAFNTYSRAKAKTDLSEIIPSNNKYLMRRAALSGASGVMTGSPARGMAAFLATSPKVLAAIKTAGELVPDETKTPIANAVVDVLRQYRRRKQQQEEE